MRVTDFLALGTAVLLSTGVLAQEAQLRDLTVEQATVAQAGIARPGSLHVSLAADRADATYSVGEVVRLTLTSNEEAYVTVLDVGPTGQVTQLFPNQYQTDNHVYPNRPVEIAGGNSGAKVTVVGPVGAELIKVIASSKPLTVVSEAQLQGRGLFRTIDGGTQALLRDLQVSADHAAQSETKIAFTNFALRTIGTRAAAAATLVVVPGHQAPAMVNTPAPQPAVIAFGNAGQQPFPLLVATDRQSYRVGDRVTLAVTPTQACALTVLDVTASGQIRTLFPNSTVSNNAVGAMQTVIVADGTSPVSLPVSGPVGTEQIVAICSTDATPTDAVSVASRPAATTAMASVTFAVQP